jgi:hypothetical protein
VRACVRACVRVNFFANELVLESREAEVGLGGGRDVEPCHQRQSLATPREEEGKGEQEEEEVVVQEEHVAEDYMAEDLKRERDGTHAAHLENPWKK